MTSSSAQIPRKVRLFFPFLSLWPLVSAAGGCRTGDPTPEMAVSDPASAGLEAAPPETGSPAEAGPKLCVAVRGDDGHLFAQVAALARVVELEGPVGALSGGGDSAATLFLYESMVANPAVAICGQARCSSAEAGARLSLMLKSLEGYVAAAGRSSASVALLGIAALHERAAELDYFKLLANDDARARDAVLAALDSPAFRDVTSGATRAWLRASDHPLRDARRLAASLASADAKSGVNPAKSASRPPLLETAGLATVLAEIGTFYAGADQPAAWQHFLDTCAGASVGEGWTHAAGQHAPRSSCGRVFLDLVRASRPAGDRSQASVGAELPVLLGTGVITERDAVERLTDPDFVTRERAPTPLAESAWALGYYGREADLARVEANPRGYRDAKSRHFLSLGPSPWLAALRTSLAQPGLTDLPLAGEGRLAVGGWADPHPVQALRNLGCDTVVYVTRRGDDPATALATSLGVADDAVTALYGDSRAPVSDARAVALREAGGVWCTDWGAFSSQQILDQGEDARAAPLSRQHLTPGLNAYPGTRDRLEEPGCTAAPAPKTSAARRP